MKTIPDRILNDFHSALLNGRKDQCSALINELTNQDKHSLEEIYEHLLKPSLYKVGELWEDNKISVASEQMASSIVESLLTELYLQLQPSKPNGKRAVLSGVQGELHQIGVKMVNDILEKNGWDTYFLGSNVPVKDLIHFSKGINPELFAFSMSLHFNLPALLKLMTEIRIHFPNTPAILGGQGFARVGHTIPLNFKNVDYCRDLYELELYLQKN